jgi:hypothetical protein
MKNADSKVPLTVNDRKRSNLGAMIPGKWIHKVYGAVMLGVVIVAFVPGMLAKKEMKGFCESLAVGSSVQTLKSQALARNYEFTVLADNQAVVEDEGNYGPQRCELRFGASGLASATYFFY